MTHKLSPAQAAVVDYMKGGSRWGYNSGWLYWDELSCSRATMKALIRKGHVEQKKTMPWLFRLTQEAAS